MTSFQQWMNQFFASFAQFWSLDHYSASDARTPDCPSLTFLRVLLHLIIEVMHGYGDLSRYPPILFRTALSLHRITTHGLQIHEPCITLPSYLGNPRGSIWDAELVTRGAISLHVVSAPSVYSFGILRDSDILADSDILVYYRDKKSQFQLRSSLVRP